MVGIQISDPSKRLSRCAKSIEIVHAHKGVQGIVIATHDGTVVRSTLDNIQTQQYSTLVTQLATKGKGVVRDLDPEDDLTFLRIRSKKHEIMIAETKSYVLMVIQNPHEL
ncbi:hypothetical protein BJ742DRAFT_776426 [Cladochytrium replicatum]|nr:hypothetical protein BJ742DRAFT_776426 [Cladochytrium replicatum]